jgi:predicted nucleic acid-binding protein
MTAALFSGDLIIDTNIWLKTGTQYDRLFTLIGKNLADTGHHVLMSDTQLNEIGSLQAKPALRSAALLALRRIEELRNNGIRLVQPAEAARRSRTYADPVIKRQVLEKAAKGEAITLLSCDQGLCSKVRAAVKKIAGQRVQIYDEDRIIEYFNAIVAGL